MLRSCTWRVQGSVFVVSIGHFCLAALRGVGGGIADMGGGGSNRVSSSRGAGLFFWGVGCVCVFHLWLYFWVVFPYF